MKVYLQFFKNIYLKKIYNFIIIISKRIKRKKNKMKKKNSKC